MSLACNYSRDDDEKRREHADLHDRAGLSRDLLDSPPSLPIGHHCACVGTCISTHNDHYLLSQDHRNHNAYQDAHSLKRACEMQDATSAPACANAKTAFPTWQFDTCQAKQTFHYHHHYHHWPTVQHQLIRSGHAGPTAAIRYWGTPHDFCSHEGPTARPPINCPVNFTAPSRTSPVPATRLQFRMVSSRESKLLTAQAAEVEDLQEAAVCAVEEASSSTLLGKAGPCPPLEHCSIPPLPPFPSLHSPPYILCQHCSRLLHLPPGALLLPLPGTPLRESSLYVKLKCGFCLKLSKFSIRHLLRASSLSPAKGVFPSLVSPTPVQSMPSCITSNGVMRESSRHILSETEVPINGKFEPALDFNSVNSEVQSKADVPVALNDGKGLHADESVTDIVGLLNGTFGEIEQFKRVETGALLNCEHARTPGTVYDSKDLDGICRDLPQSFHVDPDAPFNGDCAKTEANGIKTGGNANSISLSVHSEAGALVSRNCGQTSEKDNEARGGNVGAETSHQNEIEMVLQDDGAVYDYQVVHILHADKEQEITAYSSVQEWVDSLSADIGYESDGQFQTPLNSLSKFADKSDNIVSEASFRDRSPLHQHFGYSSPSELFEKALFSEDEEIKARTETSSTASSSFSSMNACQPSGTKRSHLYVNTPSLRSWDISADHSGVISPNRQDGQKSLASLLKKSLKVGSLLPVTPKSRVVVNGHKLSSAVIKQAEERAGKLRPGCYWYDCKAGFWGVEGGPCLGILPPLIEELNYPMAKQCSNGDTEVYVNGRELHAKDLTVLSQRGLSRKTGRSYTLGFDGVLVDEATGLELKQLGKLAPTVERRGKGFGMFTAADALQQSRAPAGHHQIKPTN